MKPLSDKYRPKSLSGIIGQEVAVKILENSFKSNQLHHAYVFAGRFGTGKTSTARIVAAMENCTSDSTSAPCGECENCKDIFNDDADDIREVDGGSTRGIDDVREIIKGIAFCPIKCKTKYVIIDEAHSLTGQAFEALLKPLEEPPENVRWILCTTEENALKETIRSRCIVLWFSDISWYEINDYLKKIVKQENIAVADEMALKIIARRSNKSLRNALKNLQTVSVFCNDGPITVEAVQKVLGVVDEEIYFKLIDDITAYNVPAAMLTINKLMTKGINAENIIEGLLEHLRNLMTINACKQNVDGLGFTEDEVKRYASQGEKANTIFASIMMNLVQDVQKATALNLEPHYFLEKFVVDSIVELSKIKKLEQKRQLGST
jgi:DNA polymerase-3 subunit gamma/tau